MRTDGDPAADLAALRFHGDRERAEGLVDLAVNVRAAGPPEWLRSRLTDEIHRLGAYPDDSAATAAVAERHSRQVGEVLLTHGAAEAFVLLARALRPRRPVVVHPQFTEPEAALRDAGCDVRRVVLEPPFTLAPGDVPADADLVVVGNPTNPTSVLHPRAVLRRLARPDRVLVVDEAFMDTVPGEPESLAGDRGTPGLVVVRSLTKQFALAGLRAGYLLAPGGLVRGLWSGRPLWPVSSLAVAAVEACMSARARSDSQVWAERTRTRRHSWARRLAELPGVQVGTGASASFLLLRVPDGERVRGCLRSRGFAVRRCDTFPGLGPDWMRVAVRDEATHERFAQALSSCLPEEVPQCW